MNQACYDGLHASLYLPIGIAAVLVFCLIPPVAATIIMWKLRHSLMVRACLCAGVRVPA